MAFLKRCLEDKIIKNTTDIRENHYNIQVLNKKIL